MLMNMILMIDEKLIQHMIFLCVVFYFCRFLSNQGCAAWFSHQNHWFLCIFIPPSTEGPISADMTHSTANPSMRHIVKPTWPRRKQHETTTQFILSSKTVPSSIADKPHVGQVGRSGVHLLLPHSASKPQHWDDDK